MRKFFTVAGVAAAALLVAVAPTSAAPGKPPSDGGDLTIAVYGDAPYGTNPTDNSEFLATPAFIGSINADHDVRFVVHVGDIHSGKQFCTEAYDRSIASLWTAYDVPLVYTPGDNEWADCHKAGEGGGTYNAGTGQIQYVTDPATGQPADYASGNPVANLALIRAIFFAHPGEALGGGHLPMLSQATVADPAHPTDAQFVENTLWERNGIVFVTVNLPGGSNDDADVWYGAPTASADQTQEAAARNGADLRWLDTAFALAGAEQARGVVVVTQADMWDLDGKTAAHVANYEPFVASIAAHTTSFGGPVLLFNGDSHIYRSDNPLDPTAGCLTESGATEVACASESAVHPGYDVPNFHRIVVHGSTFPLEWLKLTIHPQGQLPAGSDSFGPFSWARQIQPQS